jgi:photosystem II stability/assembly factor-like uncharacterized protein
MLSSTKSRLSGKTFLQTLFCFLLATQMCFAQWSPQTSGSTKMLFSVYFISENTGWACGDEGEILKTTDGGNSWAPQTSNTIYPLYSIYFISESTGWAVGGHHSPLHGLILNTTDGGNNWETQTDSIPYQLFSVYFVSQTTGWVAGNAHQIFKTTDSGTNWAPQVAEAADYQGIFFTNENIGWAVGGSRYNTYSKILKTTDGGVSWVPKTIGTNNYLRALYFISETTGWVTGNFGIMFKTTDGGENWEEQTSGISGDLYSIHFENEDNGWALGADGRIIATTNGGMDWMLQTSGTNNTLYSIYFTDINTGWVVGDYGTILHTTNGGVSFVEEEQIDEIPTEFLLSQNYPNPFNPSTSIQYAVSSRQFVSLKVYDVLGIEIETLINEEKPTGAYEITWNAEALPSGVYFYQLKAGEFISTKKMILLQ